MSSRGKTVVSTFPWWISSMLFSKNIPSLCYLVTISWWFRANSVDSCSDSSTWRKNRNPEKGTDSLTTSNGKSLDTQVVTIDLQKKQTFNKHITRNHNIISKKPHLNHLKIKSIEPPHYSPAQQQFFGPSAWELELAARGPAFAWEKIASRMRGQPIREDRTHHLGMKKNLDSHVSIPSQSFSHRTWIFGHQRDCRFLFLGVSPSFLGSMSKLWKAILRVNQHVSFILCFSCWYLLSRQSIELDSERKRNKTWPKGLIWFKTFYGGKVET